MRRMLRFRPSPAFVLAFIALSVALGGTATALRGIDSVTKNDIRANAVGKAEIRTNAVGKAEAAADSIGTLEVIEEALTGAQINEPTLQGVGTAAGLTHFAVIASNGAKVRSRNMTGSGRTGQGTYNVTFNRTVSGCAYLVSLGGTTTQLPSGTASAAQLAGTSNGVRVRTRNATNGNAADRSFHLALVC